MRRRDFVGKLTSSFEPDYFVPEDAVRTALRERSMFNLLHLESVVKVDLIVRNLMSPDVDAGYLRQWAPELGVSELLEDCLAERHQP